MNVRSTQGLSSGTEFYHNYIYLDKINNFIHFPFSYLRQIGNYGFLAERYDFWNARLVYGFEHVVKNIEREIKYFLLYKDFNEACKNNLARTYIHARAPVPFPPITLRE